MGIKADLLTRLAAIQANIVGVTRAVPRLYDVYGLVSAPDHMFLNGIERITPETGGGNGYASENVRVVMRYVSGALGAGIPTQHEDDLQGMYDKVQAEFAKRWALQDPTTAQAFPYLNSTPNPVIAEIIGGRALEFSQGTVVLAADFILVVRLHYPIVGMLS
jgi:hypothetical protein